MENKRAIIIVNSITMIRIIGTLIMPLVYVLLSPGGLVVYIICLLLTDALDGMLARRLKACTLFGSILDIAADKLLGISTLAVLARYYPIMLLPIITETLIMIINTNAAFRGTKVESSVLGKIKTIVLSIAIIGGFCTVYAQHIIAILDGSNNMGAYLISFFSNLNLNAGNIITGVAFVTLGTGIMVSSDYYIRAKHDIKKAKDSGLILENIKMKKWDELKKVLFSQEYYEKTKKEPLIKKVAVVDIKKGK